jgi:hypothetical protein
MRHTFALVAFLFVSQAHAGVIHLPGETGASVYEDDWSIPTHRCIRSPDIGMGVYDGAERCAIEFAIPLEPGTHLGSVRALYEDGDFTSHFKMQVLLRDVTTGGNLALVSGIDHDPSLTVLEMMSLTPDLELPANAAAFVLIEVRGDTFLKSLSYDFK